ncbi:MAG: AAA family ATPase, partial [Bdellovibrionales bacterium]|nr:AAA family ATPase [Bdellovibrionales bacterium]
MRISRLEIFGFKSFMERFVLNFDEPLIAIVGPNGCGKSNIVDSLRWGLGETHAKQLRGSVLEDVIFNGSETRRPLGMAEVSITLRPHEGWHLGHLEEEPEDRFVDDAEREEGAFEQLAETVEEETGSEELARPLHSTLMSLEEAVPGLFDASEIQLTRRLYRSGESEYFINRVPCRLRDMSDFYRAIGLGPRGLSIVQQGQIGQIVTRRPTERRELLEEAAGISGIRVRIEAAARQLDKTYGNLERLADLIGEIDKQVRSLRRQANRAKRRDELKVELKDADIRLFQARTARLIRERGEVRRSKESLHVRLEELNRSIQSLSGEEEDLRARVEEIDVELTDMRREKES